MTRSGEVSGPHILVFPYPAQGHNLALFDLTHQLCLRNFIITIISTPKNLPLLSPLLSAHPHNIHTLVLRLPSHPKLPPGIENVQHLGNSGNLPIICALSKLYDPIAQWFDSHPNPPLALISDFFLGWTLRLADQFRIPRFAFFSVGAALAAVSACCWENLDGVRNLEVVEFDDLPGSPSFKEELPSIFRRYSGSDPDWETVRDGMLANYSSYGCIINTCEALEGEYLSWLKRKMGHERVYGVGPLNLLGPDRSLRGDPDSDSFDHLFDWLNGCPDGSVLYVCFGSQKVLNNQQMEALASGLEKSMARFIWVVKSGLNQQVASGFEAVPDGFEERVAGRGVVIRGWVPQVKVLSHRAVGGFLSHCGWNSVLEGLVNGVMILAWPMEADQFVNEKLLVEDLGVAVKVCSGADSVPDSDELGRLIGESMNAVGRVEKNKAEEMKREAVAAVNGGGTSFIDLVALVNDMCKLQNRT